MAGCEWNNKLAHEIFEENSKNFGKEKALQLLRNDIRSWVWEPDSKPFNWSYRLKDNQLISETLGKSMTGMIEDSINGPHVNTLAVNVRENAPLELATAEEVTKRAARGDKEIKFLEYYRTESGETVVRYITVLTKDVYDKRRYHGSRIDLGENFSVEEALKRSGEKVVIPAKIDKKATLESMQPRYSAVHTVIGEVPQSAVRLVTHTASEIGYTARSVQRYIEKRKKEKGNEKRVKTDPKFVDIWKQVIESGKKRVRKVIRTATQTIELSMKARKKLELKKKAGTDSKPVIPEYTAQQAKKSVEKSIARHERKAKRLRIKQKEHLLFSHHIEPREIKKKEKKTKHQSRIRSERGLLLTEKRVLKKRKVMTEIARTKQKENLRKEKATRLFTFVKMLFRKKEQMIMVELKRKSLEKSHTGILEKKRKVREHILDFSAAFIFWIFLRLSTQTHKQKNFHVSIYESKIVRLEDNQKQEPLKYNKSEAPVSREPTQWILLAIIWYLAMIREQGQAQSLAINNLSPVKKKTITTLTSQLFPLPPRGVIFAAA